MKHNKRMKYIIYILLSLLALGILSIVLYKHIYIIFMHPEIIKEFVLELGFGGQILFILIMSLRVIVAFLPAKPLESLAGYLYGPIGGLLITLLGIALGCVIVYGIVKIFGRKIVYRFFEKEKANDILNLQDEKKFEFIMLIVYLIPGTPKDAITYFLPLTTIRFIPFILISVLPRIPMVLASTISGQAIDNTQYIIVFIIFMGTAILSILGLWFYQRMVMKNK
ncbi:MAG: TVP38/TMEM64 family protein [Coprobacillaceae bacterium]